MYETVLTDLKKQFGDKVLLSPGDIAPIIDASPAVQANLRSQKRFPIPVKKMGKKVGVSIYHLAEYLSTGDVKVAPPKADLSPPAPSKPVRVASRTRSREWLNAFQMQIQFQFELLKKLEVIFLDKRTPRNEPKKKPGDKKI